jgi:photosystem II stability/assembly factor-like uncharacterized protein
MKCTTVLLFVILFLCQDVSLFAQSEGWQRENSGTLSYLPTIWFATKDTGWVTDVNRGLLGTFDGGDTWTIINPSPTYNLRFIDEQTGYVALASGGLLKTSDGGKSGQLVTIPFGPTILQLFGMDTLRMYKSPVSQFAGSNDGGKTWNNPSINYMDGGMYFLTSQIGFGCGTQTIWSQGPPPPLGHKGEKAGHFEYTTDGGTSWHEKFTGVQEDLGNLFAVSDSTIFISGSKGSILHTSDAGNNWDTSFVGDDYYEKIFFINPYIGYAFGATGTIVRTENGGKTWLHQSSTVTTGLRNAIFVDSLHGWACGDQGTIIHTNNGGFASGTVQQNKTDFQVQVFPNPTPGLVTIQYSLLSATTVSFIFTDARGAIVGSIPPQIQNSGLHQTPFDGSSLSNGVYYFQLSTSLGSYNGQVTIER